MKIGFRTFKTAVGICLSILIAQSMQLEYFSSAAILTLLCIQKTRKQSVKAVLDRFFACLIGLGFAGLLFSIFGFAAPVFLLLYLLFIPVTVRLNIQGGIASSSVIIMHSYVNGDVNTAFFLNELGIITIGLGVALLVNLYMPGLDKQMEKYKSEIDRNMSVILKELAKYLKEGYGLWDGKELLVLSDLLQKARDMAIMETENQITRKVNPYFYHFELKRHQFQILERMIPLVSRIELQLEQGSRIGQFMEDISDHIGQLKDNDLFLRQLKEIREYHKGLPMPQNRSEFESRANLFTLANEMESLLVVR